MSAETKKAEAPRVDMVNIEVDGVAMEAPKGSMIIEATDKAGISIPRFCYHRKLTVAANCRMCLVDVEKAPKPMPACATPVMDGMKVFTQSRRAIDAQHGVMEFLLINHPLDCPICDQGGECELQDLAMGYGRSVSRFVERKRVVKDKNVGALVQTDMTRCIHCTRCIRFLEEIAGTTEMGGAGRGDRLEVGTVVQNSIDSELSGNIIDLCPVGALTNKPFRYSARAWELVAKPSIGAHDGVGSFVYHHSKSGRILRSVPRENEATNETWLSDRDRYSQQGLYAADRVMQPMIKVNGEWQTASWDEALKASARLLRSAGEPESAGLNALVSPNAATEELYLAQHLVRELGGCIDHRLREQDFSDDATRAISPAFEMTIAQMQSADAVLLVGCNPRHEAPILGHRLRKAWQSGGRISAINPLDWEFIFDIEHNIVAAPQYMLAELASVALAVADVIGKELPSGLAALAAGLDPEARHQGIAERLHGSERGLLMLGQFAMNHHEAAALRALAKWIADASNCALNLLPFGVNSVGAWMAGAVPHRGPGGSSVAARNTAEDGSIAQGATALLWDLEPEFDVDNPGATVKALKSAKAVIAVSVFATESLKELADVILPLAPLAESEGSIVNLDGERMNFAPSGKVQGEARPGWKILRWLGDHLGFEGFSQVTLTELQTQVYAAIETQLASSSTGEKSAHESPEFTRSKSGKDLYRVGEVPMFSTDPLCRRATALQKTIHAQSQFVGLNPADAGRLGLIDGGTARVTQNDAYVDLPVTVSDRVPPGAAWVRSAICSARELGSASGIVGVELA